jgi:hypothetical protein
MPFPEYAGMSYEQASREAERLVQRKGWFQSFDRLTALREIMQRAR